MIRIYFLRGSESRSSFLASQCSLFDPFGTLREEVSIWVCLFCSDINFAFASSSLATKQLLYELGLIFADVASSSEPVPASPCRGQRSSKLDSFLSKCLLFRPIFLLFSAVTNLEEQAEAGGRCGSLLGYPLRKWPRQCSCSALLLH